MAITKIERPWNREAADGRSQFPQATSPSKRGANGQRNHSTPSFPKSIGRRKDHQLINNGNTLQDCNKSPYRWRDEDPLIKTTKKHYKHHI